MKKIVVIKGCNNCPWLIMHKKDMFKAGAKAICGIAPIEWNVEHKGDFIKFPNDCPLEEGE